MCSLLRPFHKLAGALSLLKSLLEVLTESIPLGVTNDYDFPVPRVLIIRSRVYRILP